MDVDELLKGCQAIVPAGFLILMIATWFPEYMLELIKFLSKAGVGTSVFLMTWEVVKRAKRRCD